MPLGTSVNDELRNWQFNRLVSSTKCVNSCRSTDYGNVMCGLIPHYGEEMAGEKFDYQLNRAGRPTFSSAM